jgi:RecB family exonuclease
VHLTEPPVKTWSFSALKKFEACPYQIFLNRVERSPKPVLPENNPMQRGIAIHKEAELFVKGEGELTKNLTKHVDRFNELRTAHEEGRVEAEETWCFDRSWQPVAWENPSKWLINITDVTEHISDAAIRISDYKTGKSFGNEIKHGEQMQLGAVAGFMRYPLAQTVEVELIYLDEKKLTKRSFARPQVPALLDRWEKRAARMTEATAFPPKPTKASCRYCPYGPNNGGTGVCAWGVEL